MRAWPMIGEGVSVLDDQGPYAYTYILSFVIPSILPLVGSKNGALLKNLSKEGGTTQVINLFFCFTLGNMQRDI